MQTTCKAVVALPGESLLPRLSPPSLLQHDHAVAKSWNVGLPYYLVTHLFSSATFISDHARHLPLFVSLLPHPPAEP